MWTVRPSNTDIIRADIKSAYHSSSQSLYLLQTYTWEEEERAGLHYLREIPCLSIKVVTCNSCHFSSSWWLIQRKHRWHVFGVVNNSRYKTTISIKLIPGVSTVYAARTSSYYSTAPLTAITVQRWFKNPLVNHTVALGDMLLRWTCEL